MEQGEHGLARALHLEIGDGLPDGSPLSLPRSSRKPLQHGVTCVLCCLESSSPPHWRTRSAEPYTSSRESCNWSSEIRVSSHCQRNRSVLDEKFDHIPRLSDSTPASIIRQVCSQLQRHHCQKLAGPAFPPSLLSDAMVCSRGSLSFTRSRQDSPNCSSF